MRKLAPVFCVVAECDTCRGWATVLWYEGICTAALCVRRLEERIPMLPVML